MGFSPESYTFMTMGRLTLESIEHRASERTVDARPSILRTRLVPQRSFEGRNLQRPRRRIRSSKQLSAIKGIMNLEQQS